ncbi:MAG: BppU family phage baseplate upper protein [Paeniclostridium sordellii]|nr:BppU family phage baseplate upper protein [Paeniclostridium sordellii]
MATQAQTQGRYAVINTTLNTTDVTLIDALSGRQGDSGRLVYFAMKDGNLPHNLDGQNVVLTAKDSAGKVKQISGVQDMISATGGLFSMLIPGEMYQSAGDVEEAYISVQDGAGTVISSIPVTFTVVANNILFTANASKDYIDSVQQAVNEANARITGLNDNIKAQQLAYTTLKTAVENLAGQINSKQVSMLNVDNHFTGTATFDKPIVGALATRAATFTDFAVVAKNMITYAGNWYVKGNHIANDPIGGIMDWYNVLVIPGDVGSDGTIIVGKYAESKVYTATVSDGKLIGWKLIAGDAEVVHTTGNEAIAGDKSFTGNVNVSGVVSSSKNYVEFNKPINTPVISGKVTMWYGWTVYYHVQNNMVTYQFQSTGSTIPSGTISSEKLPKEAIPLYKTFVPLVYGGQGFAINIDGSLENYTGTSISGASWASASSHVLNPW